MIDLTLAYRPAKISDTVVNATMSLVKEAIKVCDFSGKWKLLFMEQIRWRGEEIFRPIRVENNYIKIRTKAKGNDSAWESALVPPPEYDLHEVFVILLAVNPRRLKLEIPRDNRGKKDRKKARLYEEIQQPVSNVQNNGAAKETVPSQTVSFSLRVDEKTTNSQERTHALVAVAFVTDPESNYAKLDQVYEIIEQELVVNEEAIQRLLNDLVEENMIRVSEESCYLLHQGQEKIRELQQAMPPEMQERLYAESLLHVVTPARTATPVPNDSEQTPELTKIQQNLEKMKPLIERMESLSKSVAEYDLLLRDLAENIRKKDEKALLLKVELQKIEAETAKQSEELYSWSVCKENERQELEKITNQLKEFFH